MERTLKIGKFGAVNSWGEIGFGATEESVTCEKSSEKRFGSTVWIDAAGNEYFCTKAVNSRLDVFVAM